MAEFKSLLPPSTSALERAIEQVLAERLESIERDLKTYLDPWQCRVDLLPYLAWEMSVDYWEDEWPEQIKRQVVAASIEVHSRKGTADAVRKALAAVDVAADLNEWYVSGGQPYTASVTAYAHSNLIPSGNTLLTPQLQQQIGRVIDENKPLRTHVEFTVGVGFTNPLSVAAAAGCKIYGRDSWTCQPPDQPILGTVYVAGAGRADVVDRRPLAVGGVPTITAKTYTTLAASSALAVNRVQMRMV